MRYVWSFQIGKKRHLLEFIDGQLGLKKLVLDQKEIYNQRSVLSSEFKYKFIVDNQILLISKDSQDYDVFLDDHPVTAFKDLLKRNKNTKTNFIDQTPFDNDFSQPKKQFASPWDNINNETPNQAKQQSSKAIFENFDFNTAGKQKDQDRVFDSLNIDFNFPGDNQPQQSQFDVNNPFGNDTKTDWSFKEAIPKKRNYSIFDKPKQRKPVNKNFFEDVNDSFQDIKLVKNEQTDGFKTEFSNNSISKEGINVLTFDEELKINQEEHKKSRKGPFNKDPEEQLEAITDGFKSMFKKAKKVVNKLE